MSNHPSDKKVKKITKDLECGIPGILAHLIDKPIDESRRIISAYLIDAETRERISREKNHKYDCRLRHPNKERTYFAHHLAEKYKGNKGISKSKQKSKITLEEGIVSQAYKKFLEMNNCDMDSDLRFAIRYSPRWHALSTRQKAVTYFEKTVLPELDRICNEQGTITQSSVDALYDLLVEKSMSKGNSNGQFLTSKRSTKKELSSAIKIYEVIQQNVPEFELPELRFEATLPKNIPGNEQIKYLSDSIRIKVATVLLYRLLPIGPACGLALMLFGGLRTAEASTPRFGDIIPCKNYAICTVRSQVRGRETDSRLKTDAAYRTVVLPFIFVCFYQKSLAKMRELGYSDEEIREMPFVTDGVSLDKPIQSTFLSDCIRQLLLVCGCSEDFLDRQQLYMEQYIDYDLNRSNTREVCAYILRRDFATRLSTRCGISVDTLDYPLGHRRKEDSVHDFESSDAQAGIATAMERYVFIPEFSKNPAYDRIDISEKKIVSLSQAYSRIALTPVPDSFKILSLSLRTNEPGKTIEIFIEDGISFSLKNIDSHSVKDSPQKRIHRPAIAAGTTDIQRTIQEGLSLDITKLKMNK